MTLVTKDFTVEDFSILISWMTQKAVDNYTISTNTTTPPVTTTMTTLALEEEYNTHLEITIAANDCGGTSDEIIVVVHESCPHSENQPPCRLFSLSPSLLPPSLPLPLSNFKCSSSTPSNAFAYTFAPPPPSISAGCSPPIPPVNGSIAEWTSSRSPTLVTLTWF